jgi:hypothetical protein
LDKLPVHSGDWTDYWNFGSASTARETKISRKAKRILSKADFLEAVANTGTPRLTSIKDATYCDLIKYDEHTWGASDSVMIPHQEETYAQLNHKKEYAYQAADRAAYLLGRNLESFLGNPHQTDYTEGLAVINPTGFEAEQEIIVPGYLTESDKRTLDALRIKAQLPYERIIMHGNPFGAVPDNISLGVMKFPAFSVTKIPLSEPKKEKAIEPGVFIFENNNLRTPFYSVEFSEPTGRIKQIRDLKNRRDLLNTEGEWGFFDLIAESVDPRYAAKNRQTFFPRDLDLGNRSVSQWAHGWKSIKRTIDSFIKWETRESSDSFAMIYHMESDTVKKLTLKTTFYKANNRISIDIFFMKEPVETPESIYFSIPLKLGCDWECVYDIADSYVKLDEQQLGNVCRDWVTVDKGISMHDKSGGVTLACPDAPMVQVGGFNFGRERRNIDRGENPLLLAWPLNNYWDTNFAATQDGRQVFHYELTSFRTFDAHQTYKMLTCAANPCIAAAAVDCDKYSSDTLLSVEGKKIEMLFVRPIGSDGFVMALKNFAEQTEEAAVSLPRGIKSAALVDIQGNVLEKLALNDKGICVSVPANYIRFVKIVPCR